MIRQGDIVQIGNGSWTGTYIVELTSREGATRGHLIVRPVCRGHHEVRRDIRTRDVVGHWRRVRATARP